VKSVSVKEYGNIFLIVEKFYPYIEVLKTVFPNNWQQILAIVYCRFVYRCPLKSIPYRLESSYFYDQWPIKPFGQKEASGLLNYLGQNLEKLYEYMRSFIQQGSYLLIDGTHIISKSEQIDSVKRGYNKQRNFDGQFNLMYIYSASQHMPVFYRLLAGNIRDVKGFKNTLALAHIKDAVIVADKGFYSKVNIQLLVEEGLDFIIPLKRDNMLIEYSKIKDNSLKKQGDYFKYKDRYIWYVCTEYANGNLHLFLDDSLRLEEEKDFLNRITTHPDSHTHENYLNKMFTFGTIGLFSSKALTNSRDVYETYKSRMEIENAFDGLKNILNADKSYMQNEQTLQGWTFINHICLQWYHHLYVELKNQNLLKKISVNDYISLLTDIKKLNINGQYHLNEFTNQTKKLLSSLGLNLI
jgi:transposase